MTNPEYDRLMSELQDLSSVDPQRMDARIAADLELVTRRLEYLTRRTGAMVAPSPYLSFLERVQPAVAHTALAASA